MLRHSSARWRANEIIIRRAVKWERSVVAFYNYSGCAHRKSWINEFIENRAQSYPAACLKRPVTRNDPLPTSCGPAIRSHNSFPWCKTPLRERSPPTYMMLRCGKRAVEKEPTPEHCLTGTLVSWISCYHKLYLNEYCPTEARRSKISLHLR